MSDPVTLSGETSVFRFMVLLAATKIRPPTFDAASLLLPELTTSDMPSSVSTKVTPVPRMYGTAASGTTLTWAEPKPDTASWTLTLSGNTQPTEAERTSMETLFGALGKYVWIERQMHTDTNKRGGCVLITSRGEPVPSDGDVTFSIGGAGYGPNFLDTSTATV